MGVNMVVRIHAVNVTLPMIRSHRADLNVILILNATTFTINYFLVTLLQNTLHLLCYIEFRPL